MNQHEYVSGVRQYYKDNDITPGDPNEGVWEWAHYPAPKCVGGIKGLWLLREHHFVQGILQSEEYKRQCFYGDTKTFLKESFGIPGWFDLCEVFEKWYNSHQKVPCSVYDHQESHWIYAESINEMGILLGVSASAVGKVLDGGRKSICGRYTADPSVSPGRALSKYVRVWDHLSLSWVQAESITELTERLGGGSFKLLVAGTTNSVQGRYTLSPEIKPKRKRVSRPSPGPFRVFDTLENMWVEGQTKNALTSLTGIKRTSLSNLLKGEWISCQSRYTVCPAIRP